jgi:uncharacterized protein
MRKILIVLTVLTMALVPLACAAGEELRETNEATGYTLVFHDEAGLVDAAEQEKVLEAMRPVLEYANVGFMTYPAGGSSQNSSTKAQEWGDSTFGYQTRYTVFIIDMTNRHLDIYASKSLAGTLTAGVENSIADNVSKAATAGNYSKCAADAFTQILSILKGEKIATPMKYVSNAVLALIAAMLAAYLLISGWARKEQAVSMPAVVKGAAAGAATVVLASHLKRVVHHESSSGGHGGFGGGGGGGGGGGSSGGHGF